MIVSALLPNTTEPELLPERLMMEAPLVVPVMVKIALSMMLEELAIAPEPVKAKVPPEMVVVPV